MGVAEVITLDLYSHVTPTMERQAADELEAALSRWCSFGLPVNVAVRWLFDDIRHLWRAAFTLGMTSPAISSMERRARGGSIQSWPV